MSPKPETSARTAGKLLLFSAAATVVMIAARVAADADQPTLTESLQAIADSRPVYALHSAGRLIAGLALVASAWYLLQSWLTQARSSGRLATYLLGFSGAFSIMSALCTIVLAAYPAPGADIPSFIEGIADARWITGKIGFTAAGLALLAGAAYLWQPGGAFRTTSLATAVIGVAMQFIWVDAATVMHRIIGVAFFVWLVALSAVLVTGLIERHVGKSPDSTSNLSTPVGRGRDT